jgi:hypothetical protein
MFRDPSIIRLRKQRTMGTGKEKESNTANHFEDSMCRNTKQKSSIRKSLVQVNRNFEGQSNPLQITN